MAKEMVQIRKAPKYLPFLLAFATVGFIAAVFVYLTIDEADKGNASIFGLMVTYFSAVGAGIGLVLALILDGISRLRVKNAVAERRR
jgi:uncharacterized membrane protein YjjP (DUF1212 family)